MHVRIYEKGARRAEYCAGDDPEQVRALRHPDQLEVIA